MSQITNVLEAELKAAEEALHAFDSASDRYIDSPDTQTTGRWPFRKTVDGITRIFRNGDREFISNEQLKVLVTVHEANRADLVKAVEAAEQAWAEQCEIDRQIAEARKQGEAAGLRKGVQIAAAIDDDLRELAVNDKLEAGFSLRLASLAQAALDQQKELATEKLNNANAVLQALKPQ